MSAENILSDIFVHIWEATQCYCIRISL